MTGMSVLLAFCAGKPWTRVTGWSGIRSRISHDRHVCITGLLCGEAMDQGDRVIRDQEEDFPWEAYLYYWPSVWGSQGPGWQGDQGAGGGSPVRDMSALLAFCVGKPWTRARFSVSYWCKLRLCLANHRAGYFSNLACDWLSIVSAFFKQEVENGPWVVLITQRANNVSSDVVEHLKISWPDCLQN